MQDEDASTWDNIKNDAQGFRESLNGSDENLDHGEPLNEDLDESSNADLQEAMAGADEPAMAGNDAGFRERLDDESYADEPAEPHEDPDLYDEEPRGPAAF